jgi:hypothetical protein
MAGAKKRGPVKKRKMRGGGMATTKKMRGGGMAKKKGPVRRRGR